MLTISAHATALTVVANTHSAARRAVEVITRIINTNDADNITTKIGFATGATMEPVYAELVKQFQLGRVSFKNVIGVNLDEYTVSQSHPQSYHTYMWKHLYSHVDIDNSNIYIPDGGAQNPQSSCDAYNRTLDAIGPLHIQLLGIGRNGHIGFNEPPATATSRTRIIELASSTTLINDAPSSHAITMGIKDIMNASHIIMIASGSGKADIMREFMNSPADNPHIPASFIKSHPNVTILCDWDAATKIDQVRAEASKIVSRGSIDITSKLSKIKSIMVWSPHPDDDVIGVGGFMRMVSRTHDMSVVYQTTGRNAVSPSTVAYQREFLNTIFKKHSITDKTIGAAIRRVEAKTAAAICGVTDIIFIEMPFYKRKLKTKQPPFVENDDVETVKNILNEKRPDVIIYNGDSDPSHTHDHCKTAIIRALESMESPPTAYEYCSAWGEFSLSHACLLIPLTKHQLKAKKHAILAHESQNPPLVHNGNPTPFHERAIVNARDTLALLKKMGFAYRCDIVGVEVIAQ